jgi:hypothetical protein
MRPQTVRIKRLQPITGDVLSDRTEILSDTATLISWGGNMEEPLLSLELVPDEHDEQESIAFDLAFDPSAMCAVCVAGLNPLHPEWRVRAFAPNGALMDLRNIRTTARWAFELTARGGRIETMDGNVVLLHAAGIYRGTPLCEYDLTPAIMGQGPYKF